MQSQFHSYSRCFLSPPSHLHLHGFTAAPLQQVQGEKRELCEGKPIWKQSLAINHSDWFDYSVPDATGRTLLYNSSTENTSCCIPSPSRSDTTKGYSPKATASPKNWIHHSRQSEAAAFNLPSYCKCTIKYSVMPAIHELKEPLKDQFYFIFVKLYLNYYGQACIAELGSAHGFWRRKRRAIIWRWTVGGAHQASLGRVLQASEAQLSVSTCSITTVWI